MNLNEMDKQIVIPEGWTYYAHRTNTSKWANAPFDNIVIITDRLMSVVTESDIYQDLNRYGQNHLLGYSVGDGEPFEIRCLICGLPYLKTLSDDSEMKNIMLREFYYDRRNMGGCYGQRHHSIPPKEELVVLGIGNYDEVYDREQKIIWTIPRRFLDFYKKELEEKNNRVISIQRTDISQKN